MCYQNHFSIPPVSPWVLGKVQCVLLFQGFEVNHSGLISFGLWRWVECRGSVGSSEGRLGRGSSEIPKHQNIRSEFLPLHQLYCGSQAGLTQQPCSDIEMVLCCRNASCSSVLAPRKCHGLSHVEHGIWGLCCSRAGSSLEFVPPETLTCL